MGLRQGRGSQPAFQGPCIELDVTHELFGLAPGLVAPYSPVPPFAHTYFLLDQRGRSAATLDMSHWA